MCQWFTVNSAPQMNIPSLQHVGLSNGVEVYGKSKAITLVITTTIGIPRFCESMFSPKGNTTLSSSDVEDDECRG